jgi:hypothetical protein
MRWAILVVFVSSFGRGQSILEHSAAAAGGSVGGVAGKKVSDGLTAIFGKIDQQTKKAAKGTEASASKPNPNPNPNPNTPLFEVGPAVPKQRNAVPPPPPPIHRASVQKLPPMPTTRRVVPVAQPDLEPPRQASLAELRSVTSGMSRDDVLKFGTPSVRITMNEEGHLLEIYRYIDNSKSLGTLRLTDGAVSSVQVR